MISGLTLVASLAAGCALFSFLGWVGWRFFAVQNPVAVRAAINQTQTNRVEKRSSWFEFSATERLPTTFYWAVIVVLLVGGLAVGCVFSMSDRIAPAPLEALKLDRQSHIQGAFNPELLLPPPALPPTMFISSERFALETADRDWGKLNAQFTQPVLRLMARLQSRGYQFALLEGYRSPERQEKLADLGRHVTQARAFESKHQFGLAVDLAPLRDGRLVVSERDPWAMQAYMALGEEAEQAGLTWGGRWSFKDYGHVEASGSAAPISAPGQY